MYENSIWGFVVLCAVTLLLTVLIPSNKLDFIAKYMITFLVMIIYTVITLYLPVITLTSHDGRAIPIVNRGDLVGKVITPLCIDAESASVVGSDRRLYSFLDVQLEPGLSITNMVGRKLIVYKKGLKICIGIKEPEVQAVPTQIDYTNK